MKERPVATWLLREAAEALIIAGFPAVVAFITIGLALKGACSLIWNSRCQTGMFGVHQLYEPIPVLGPPVYRGSTGD